MVNYIVITIMKILKYALIIAMNNKALEGFFPNRYMH